MTDHAIRGADPLRVVFLTHRFAHHPPRSGYDRVRDFIPGRTIEARRLIRLARPLPEALFYRIRQGSGLRTYTRERCLQELAALPRFFLGRRGVFHFLYADYGYRLLGRLPNPHGHRLVGTFHRPPSELETTILDPRPLGRLDHAIILGESQRAFLRKHLPDDRVTFVPHGVDTDFYSPASPAERERRCLFVGNYLRDFTLFRATVRRLADLDPSLRFTVVARRAFLPQFVGLPRTDVAVEVQEEELRRHYRSAAVLLLPLADAVANNTILEALACGLPVVTTDVGSVGDYLEGEAGTRTARDAVALAAAARAYLDDPERRSRASRAARDLALRRFRLEDVAARTREILAG